MGSLVAVLRLGILFSCSGDYAALAAGISVDVPELIHELGATVIPTVAKRGEGVEQLKRAVLGAADLPRSARPFLLPEPIAAALAPVEARLQAAGFAPEPAGWRRCAC